MKVVTILIFTIMTTMTAVANDTKVYEIVVYRIKAEYRNNFEEVLQEARNCIMKFPGMIEHQTYRSSENELLFMDLVKWNSLEMAKSAAAQFEKIEELGPFMQAFEEIKFMEHFELFEIAENEKLDFTKADKEYYQASEMPLLVDVNNYNYLNISGVSSPEDSLFLNSIEAIYSVAYGIKFSKKAFGNDFVVPKMECQWWVDSEKPFTEVSREEWHWNIVIPMPEFVSAIDVEQAIQILIERKGDNLVSQVEFGPLNEGKSVQILHVGSYDEEEGSLNKLYQFVEDNNLKIVGRHHEIYLNDPRKTEQSKLKTILRYAVK